MTSVPLHRVALAGCTTSIGLHILSALLFTKKFSVLILTRSTALPDPSKFPFHNHPNVSGAYNFNYNADPLENARIFRENNIRTVVSTIGCTNHFPDLYNVQLNLYKASALSGTVKRFIPSEWEGSPSSRKKGSGEEIGFQGYKSELLAELAKLQVRDDSARVEVGIFCPGVFMDYYSPEYMASEDPEEGGRGWLPDLWLPFLVDFRNASACIPTEKPGESAAAVRFTLSRDVAKVVATVLAVDDWSAKYRTTGHSSGAGIYEFRVSGDRLKPKELIAIGERLTGKKFTVEHPDKEQVLKELEQARRDGEVFKGYVKEGLLAAGDGEYDWNDAGENDEDNLGRTVVNVNDHIAEDGLKLWDVEGFLRKWTK